jgi:hypothetical protein
VTTNVIVKHPPISESWPRVGGAPRRTAELSICIPEGVLLYVGIAPKSRRELGLCPARRHLEPGLIPLQRQRLRRQIMAERGATWQAVSASRSRTNRPPGTTANVRSVHWTSGTPVIRGC